MRSVRVWLAICFITAAQGAELRQTVQAYVGNNQRQIFGELVDLLAIPNVAADRPNIRRNAEFLSAMLQRRGMKTEILETQGNPLVYGTLEVAGATHTILYYAHYDGQPVDPPRWKQPSPFTPLLRSGILGETSAEVKDWKNLSNFPAEWRVYGRSTSDDKSPIMAFCAALDALKAGGQALHHNIRIVLDGEEEAGSASLAPAIARYRDKFRADLLLILDGPLHPSGRPTLNFGARGNVTLELTVFGPKFPLHSGHYGNWVPNPAMRLAQLLATMKDDDGRVLVAGFYDGIPPLTAEEHKILNAVPDDAEALKKLFGIAQPETIGNNLQEALQFPSLNIRGLRSAFVGADARTIIPSEATAAIDIRLVKETPGASLVAKVVAHIRKQGYHVVDTEPDDATRLQYPRIVRVINSRDDGTEAFRTDLSHPAAKAVTNALQKVWGQEPVLLRTSGGTVPISQFIRALGFPAVNVPTVNFDNNQHAENENLRLGHFWDAIVTMAALLTLELPAH